jgi:putative MATE family efflux protein
MTLVLAVLLSVLGYIFSERMVMFVGANEDITIKAATQYMQIQMAGFAFNALTLTTTAALRGIGKTKSSMVYNMIANASNVLFNYLLIYGSFGFPRWEVAGASLATVMGQILAFIIAMGLMLKGNEYFKLDFKKLIKIDLQTLKRIVKIGLPAMGEQLVMRAGMLIYVMTVASLGTVAYATHQIAANILSMSFMTGQAFGISATSLMGQSLGKKRVDLGKYITLETRRLGMVFALLLACVFAFGGRYLAMLYIDDPEVISEAATILIVVAFLQPLQSSQLILSGALRGAGDTRTVALITSIGILLMRPLLSFVFVRYVGLGLMGAWIAMGIDQTFRSLCSYLHFRRGTWAFIKV